jgi:hypothetical protein
MMSPSQEPSAAVLSFPGRARLPNGRDRLAKRLVLRYEGFEWADRRAEPRDCAGPRLGGC